MKRSLHPLGSSSLDLATRVVEKPARPFSFPAPDWPPKRRHLGARRGLHAEPSSVLFCPLPLRLPCDEVRPRPVSGRGGHEPGEHLVYIRSSWHLPEPLRRG